MRYKTDKQMVESHIKMIQFFCVMKVEILVFLNAILVFSRVINKFCYLPAGSWDPRYFYYLTNKYEFIQLQGLGKIHKWQCKL